MPLPFFLIQVYFFSLISPPNLFSDNPLHWKCPLVAPQAKPIDPTLSPQEQIKQIDQEIKELESLKEKFKAKAARYQDQGDRLQFKDHYVTEAKRYWDMADCALEVVKKIDEEIAMLKKRKVTLLNGGRDAIP